MCLIHEINGTLVCGKNLSGEALESNLGDLPLTRGFKRQQYLGYLTD